MKNIFALFVICLAFSVAMAQEKPEVVPGNLIVQVPTKSIDEVILANQFFEGQPTYLKLNRMLSAPMAAYLLEFDENIHHQQFLQQVWDHPGVTLIQLNHKIQQRIEPNDPQLGQQWWHINDGGGGGLADADIDSDEAWDITTGGVTATGDTIVVCIVDDGGDFDHPDLAANMWYNHNEIPDNNIDDDNNGYVDDYMGWNPVNDNDNVDGGGHGVNVAGMVGAVGDNNTGVVGVNWNVKIMTMTYGNINQEANVIEAYTYPLVMRRQYEATNGALGAFVVATNSSWGINNGDPADAPLWCAFYDTLGTAGILSAGATANNNVNIDNVGDLPTACSSEYMISVTATNNQDVRTFSGYGATTVDLGAPGEDVRTTASGGSYTTTSGTSFATPATAGAIALVYSAPCASLAAISHADPALAAQMVRDAIFDGVDPVSNLTNECVTGGRLNVKGALDQIIQNCSSGGCMPPFTLSASNIILDAADIEWNALADIDSFNISYGEIGSAAATVFDVEQLEYELEGLTPCTDYFFLAQAICDGATSDWSDTLFFTTDGCCEEPGFLELSDATDSTITATWESILAADSYLLQWRELGSSTWNNIDGIDTTTFDVSVLEPCTDYQIRIATNCDGGTTGFTPSQLLRTSGCGACTDLTYCESNGSNDQEYIGNVIIGSLDNTSADDPNGYGDYTDMSVDLQRDETYDVSFTPEYPGNNWREHFRVWIDMNHDGVFSASELLYDDDQGTTETVTGTITIPLTANLGSARMRVSMAYGSNFGGDYPQTSCDEGQDGEVEDYCVNILEEDTTSNPDGIFESSGEFGMAVYPVPTNSTLTVELKTAVKGQFALQILDVTGKAVRTINAEETRTMVDVSSLSDGIYLIQAVDGNNIFGRTRFVKQE